MKLNPSKCVFRVSSGKFLNFTVSQWGVKVNPNKIQAILEMSPPKNIKEVKSLNGRVMALNRFVSRATNKGLPFFKILKKAFEWTNECQKAFQELKAYLGSPPLLSPSKPNEELFLYLVVSPTTISSTLIREEDCVQLPVYYTSRALRGAEERYPPMEKLAFALITAACKLRPYFHAYTIVVQTKKRFQKTLDKLKAIERLVLWEIKLNEFDVQYHPRTAIKAQALANFITKFMVGEIDEWGATPWTVQTNGSSNKHAGGIMVVLQSLDGDIIKCAIRLQFSKTNNEAEYEAILIGLNLAKTIGVSSLILHNDSQVVVGHINEDYKAKGE